MSIEAFALIITHKKYCRQFVHLEPIIFIFSKQNYMVRIQSKFVYNPDTDNFVNPNIYIKNLENIWIWIRINFLTRKQNIYVNISSNLTENLNPKNTSTLTSKIHIYDPFR